MLENEDWFELEVPKCPVCWEEIYNSIIALDCGHVFHKDCITDWRKNIQSCPNCRHRIKQNSSLDLFYSLKKKVSDCYLLQTQQNMRLFQITGDTLLLREKLVKSSQKAAENLVKLNKRKEKFGKLSKETNSLMNFNQSIKNKIFDLKKINEKKDVLQKSQFKDLLLFKEKIHTLKNKKIQQEKITQELIQKNKILSQQIQNDQTQQFDYKKLNDPNTTDSLKENIIKLTVEINKQYLKKLQHKKDIEDLQKYETKKEHQIKIKKEEIKSLKQYGKNCEQFQIDKFEQINFFKYFDYRATK